MQVLKVVFKIFRFLSTHIKHIHTLKSGWHREFNSPLHSKAVNVSKELMYCPCHKWLPYTCLIHIIHANADSNVDIMSCWMRHNDNHDWWTIIQKKLWLFQVICWHLPTQPDGNYERLHRTDFTEIWNVYPLNTANLFMIYILWA
jgi:hypothetical protein